MIWEDPVERNYDQERSSQKAISRHLKDDLGRMTRRIDRLTLACHSMWELIRDNTDFTEEDLERKILEVDLRDGVVDGRMAPEILTCESCGKNTNSRRSQCLMCGAPLKRSSQFDG